jgi:hypothetical protein
MNLDPLDKPLDVAPFVHCRHDGCTKFFMPGSPFPTTARRIIEGLQSIGWTWTKGTAPTSGIPRCKEHSQQV